MTPKHIRVHHRDSAIGDLYRHDLRVERGVQEPAEVLAGGGCIGIPEGRHAVNLSVCP